MAPFQSSNDQNLFLMSKNCSKAMFEHERSIPSNFIYHNKYWFVTNKKLMIKTSFLDDRQELTLTETYLKPAEHLRWIFFAKIVNNF